MLNMTAHFLSSIASEVQFDSKPSKKLGSTCRRRRNTWFACCLKGSCDCGGGHLGWGPAVFRSTSADVEPSRFPAGFPRILRDKTGEGRLH